MITQPITLITHGIVALAAAAPLHTTPANQDSMR
jgi:hypothetical protein